MPDGAGQSKAIAQLPSEVPFLDDGCDSRQLLAAVIAWRRHRASFLPDASNEERSLAYWLDPEFACSLWPDAPVRELPTIDGTKADQVSHAIASAVGARPDWAGYFGLPIRYLMLPAGSAAISSSVPHWPQHIMLSEDAFGSPAELREQVVHEWCHQWLYLLEEISPLEHAQTGRNLLLPSGTAERAPREVIGAAHVALALIRLYEATGEADVHNEHLRTYAMGCLDVLDGHRDSLTDLGRTLTLRIRSRLND